MRRCIEHMGEVKLHRVAAPGFSLWPCSCFPRIASLLHFPAIEPADRQDLLLRSHWNGGVRRLTAQLVSNDDRVIHDSAARIRRAQRSWGPNVPLAVRRLQVVGPPHAMQPL